MSLRIVPGLPGHDRRPGAGARGLADADPGRAEPAWRPTVSSSGCRTPATGSRRRSPVSGSRTWSRCACSSSLRRHGAPPSVPPAEQVGGTASDAGGDGGARRRATGTWPTAPSDCATPPSTTSLAAERGEPARPGSAGPAAHARAPVPARLRHPGHLPGHGRARRGPRRRSPPATRTPPPTPCDGTSCCPASGSGGCSTNPTAGRSGGGLDEWSAHAILSAITSDTNRIGSDQFPHPLQSARRSRCPERCS